MGERQLTIVCIFDQQFPRISAHDIHEWIFDKMVLQGNEVAMIQVDGTRRHVYIKLRIDQRMQYILTVTNGQGEFRHTSGEISKVRIEMADLRMRRVRLSKHPPVVYDTAVRLAMGTYGEV
jgi:hypothetical protein